MPSVDAMSDYSLHSFGSGPVLALAHGAGGGIEANFAELAAHLPGRTLTGRDYPGSGSRPPAATPLTLAGLADGLVEAQLRAGNDRFPILGLSLGTTVAITAAARHPERVSGLILTVGMAEIDVQGANFATLFADLARAERWHDLARVMLLSVGTPAALATLDADAAARAIAATVADLQVGGSALIPQMELVRTVDVRQEAAAIGVPTLVIGAGQDRTVLPSSTRRLAELIPGAEYVELPEAGHIFTPAETPTWAAQISAFLAKHRL